MRKNTSRHHGVFWPDFVARSVVDIDFYYLNRIGIKAVMIDLDGTVVVRGGYEVSKQVSKVLKDQELKVYIATNRPKSRDLKNLEAQLSASGVIHPKGLVGKPFAHYYKKSLQILKLRGDQVAMIGDRYIQDIYGANRAGLVTIHVDKLGESANIIDSFISYLESRHSKKIDRHYKPLQ